MNLSPLAAVGPTRVAPLIRPAVNAVLIVALSQAVVACGATTGNTASQPPQLTSRYVLEQTTHDRWLRAAQRSEFSPFAETTSALYLDVPSGGGERTIRIAMRAPGSGDSASLTVRPDGRVVRQEAWLRPMPPMPMALADSTQMRRFRLLVGGRLVLPLARTWDVVPQVHPRRFARGERWTDTIALATELEGARQTIDGVRMSVLLRDTMVTGRRLWIVRDSAPIRYTERDLEFERTLGTRVTVEQTATGTVRSSYLYDPDLGLFRERDDTTALSGEAVLTYPDGRSFRTPIRYDRGRRWTLYDTDAYATHQAELRAQNRRAASGPVRSPATEVERRLAAGDSTFRDSLTSAWEGERNPDRRAEAYRLLMSWAPGGQPFRDALERRRAAAGDSAFILEQLAKRAYPARPPIDMNAAQQMIRVMRDPGIPFSFGVSRDALYENLVQTLVTWPRAIAPDTTEWHCVPEACRLLEAQWRLGEEPRLRDVGLTALATGAPAQWADSAIARAAAGSSLIGTTAMLANGVGSTWPAAAKLPLPTADADWRAWLAWSNAVSPAYRPPPMPPGRRSAQAEMRFEESHATAIRFYQSRTGRDVIGEISRQSAAATDDSARMVYGTILMGLGNRRSVEEIAAQFRSGSAPQIALAQRALLNLFQRRAPLADSATTVALLDRSIAASVSGVERRSQAIPPRQNPTPPPNAPQVARPRPDFYVLADSVPPALREKWRDRVRFIGQAEWQALPDRQAAELLTLSSVERIGPFVRVRTQISGRLPRQPNETPHLFYSGTEDYLLVKDDGWVAVMTSMWIT